MSRERFFLACYDIANPKRLRKVEKIVNGYGYRIQESVFLCCLTDLLRAEMIMEITNMINHAEDQFILIDLGADPDILDKATVIGKKIIKIPKITFI